MKFLDFLDALSHALESNKGDYDPLDYHPCQMSCHEDDCGMKREDDGTWSVTFHYFNDKVKQKYGGFANKAVALIFMQSWGRINRKWEPDFLEKRFRELGYEIWKRDNVDNVKDFNDQYDVAELRFTKRITPKKGLSFGEDGYYEARMEITINPYVIKYQYNEFDGSWSDYMTTIQYNLNCPIPKDVHLGMRFVLGHPNCVSNIA
jgi:hypothetical protein